MTIHLTITPSEKLRASGAGPRFYGIPGPCSAITNVPGVTVCDTNLISGTVHAIILAILPRQVDCLRVPVLAGLFCLNGNGELTGSHRIEEAGKLSLPITITHSSGLDRDATIHWAADTFPGDIADDCALLVAAETHEGFLNDINGVHAIKAHVRAAIYGASGGVIDQGSVGGGTGIRCCGFKAGSGTESRHVACGADDLLGVFVQASFGTRKDVIIQLRRVGRDASLPQVVTHAPVPDLSPAIVVIASDAPFLPRQFNRLALRASLAIGRIARHGSGNIFLAFSKAGKGLAGKDLPALCAVTFEPGQHIDPFFEAVVQATKEAILNSRIANDNMTGRDGKLVPALPHAAPGMTGALA